MGTLEKNRQEEPDTPTKLEKLKRVLENKIKNNSNNVDAVKKLEEMTRLEIKTREKTLTLEEKDRIENEYAALNDLERMIAESPDIITKPQKVTPEPPKDFMSNIGTMVENLQNSLAYHLAPILSALQSIPFLAGDGNISMLQAFLGGEKTMMFGSLRQKNLEPVFNAKEPSKDTESINAIIAMAKKVQSIHGPYTLKRFFDKVATKFAEKQNGERKFKLEDLVTFTEQHVLPEEEKIAQRDAELAPPVALPPPGTEVKLKAEGNDILSSYGEMTYAFHSEAGQIVIKDKNNALKKWKLVTRDAGDMQITISALKLEGNTISMTATPPKIAVLNPDPQPVTELLKQDALEQLMINVTKGTRYDFESKKVDAKTKVESIQKLSFMPA